MTFENPFQHAPFYDSLKKRLKTTKGHWLVFDLNPAPEKDLDAAVLGSSASNHEASGSSNSFAVAVWE